MRQLIKHLGSFALAICLLFSFSISPVSALGFEDVAATSYYAEAVEWAVSNGIATGTDTTHFSPDAPCPRGEIVSFMWLAAGGVPMSENYMRNPFSDLDEGNAYYEAALWALDLGITTGIGIDEAGKVTFSSNDTVTRAQAVTFLYREAEQPEVEVETIFSDIPSGAYYEQAVAWAVARKITTGTSATTFSPDEPCTRGQILTFLYRARQ